MSRPAQATWERRHGLRGAAVGALVDGRSLIATTLRLLARHWPVLIALYLAGVLAREVVMRAAVWASKTNAELGMLVLLLAPMATLTALVLMLRVLHWSLPTLAADGAPPSMLAHLASVLIPFIAIYEIDGSLQRDVIDYNLRVLGDLQSRAFEDDLESFGDRVPYELSVGLVALVAGVIVARWLLSRVTDAAPRHRWLGLPGAYLELVWIMLVTVVALGSALDLALDWGREWRVAQVLRDAWNQLASPAGDAGPLGWFVEQLGRADAVLVIPLAWLAVGAVVMGTDAPDPDPTTTKVRESALYLRTQSRWQTLPGRLRWLLASITADLQERFALLGQGLRILWRAGLPLMMLFCLAFVATNTVADWLWRLQRLLIGPRDTDRVWAVIEAPLSTLNDAVATTVLVCLLGAAIELAVRASASYRSDPAGSAPAGSGHREPGVVGPRVEDRQP